LNFDFSYYALNRKFLKEIIIFSFSPAKALQSGGRNFCLEAFG